MKELINYLKGKLPTSKESITNLLTKSLKKEVDSASRYFINTILEYFIFNIRKELYSPKDYSVDINYLFQKIFMEVYYITITKKDGTVASNRYGKICDILDPQYDAYYSLYQD